MTPAQPLMYATLTKERGTYQGVTIVSSIRAVLSDWSAPLDRAGLGCSLCRLRRCVTGNLMGFPAHSELLRYIITSS